MANTRSTPFLGEWQTIRSPQAERHGGSRQRRRVRSTAARSHLQTHSAARQDSSAQARDSPESQALESSRRLQAQSNDRMGWRETDPQGTRKVGRAEVDSWRAENVGRFLSGCRTDHWKICQPKPNIRPRPYKETIPSWAVALS